MRPVRHLGDEEPLGDMDFKVAGFTEAGITSAGRWTFKMRRHHARDFMGESSAQAKTLARSHPCEMKQSYLLARVNSSVSAAPRI